METPGIFPFERPYAEVEQDLDAFADAVIASLESSFLVMPKGQGFVEYQMFERAYEILRAKTNGFSNLAPDVVTLAIEDNALVLVVLRAILGFTPPEWAHLTVQRTGCSVSQGYARSIDRTVRLAPEKALRVNEKISAMIATACDLLQEGASKVGNRMIHRLDKADTVEGQKSVQAVSQLGVPYAMLLYERLLGRPFASHRDSISELVGDFMETPVEEVLCKAGVAYRKTKRAERVVGFEQAPDFIIPDEFNPEIVIEAKITEDDGTARDKVTRIQHLETLSRKRIEQGKPGFQVIACIDGRGFGIRKEDMKKIIRATEGKVFTLATLDRLVMCSDIGKFRTKD